MYEDKTLVCKECGKEFVFTASSLLYVQLAAERPEFLSSRSLIARFTAASASRE